MKLATIILAAGKGKRMNDPEKPKVMFPLHGKPMIDFVVELAINSGSEKVILVVGHKREIIIEHIQKAFSKSMNIIEFITQEEQLGTGHAVMQAKKVLENFNGNILILSGDVPLLKDTTIMSLEAIHKENSWTASLISGIPENPFGYGRILRNNKQSMVGIREEKDASETEKSIQEINSGIYLVNCISLFEALSTIQPNNAQGEYYLTDIFEYFTKNEKSVGAFRAENILEITGVNTKEQLDELERVSIAQ